MARRSMESCAADIVGCESAQVSWLTIRYFPCSWNTHLQSVASPPFSGTQTLSSAGTRLPDAILELVAIGAIDGRGDEEDLGWVVGSRSIMRWLVPSGVWISSSTNS